MTSSATVIKMPHRAPALASFAMKDDKERFLEEGFDDHLAWNGHRTSTRILEGEVRPRLQDHALHAAMRIPHDTRHGK